MADPWLIGASVMTAIALALAPARRGRVARLALGVVCGFLLIKSLWLVRAIATLEGIDGPPVEVQIVEARWPTLREWHVYQGTPRSLRHVIVAPDRRPTVVGTWDRAPETPLVTRSRVLDTVRNLLAVHELAFAHENTRPGGDAEVLWSDIRYCWSPGTDEIATPVGPVVTGPDSRTIACGLWFGGTFDIRGRPLAQRVHVFGALQTRAPRRQQ